MKLFNTIWSRLVALESLYERGPSYLFSHRLTKRWNEKNGISLNGWAMNTRVWCDNLTILDEYDVALEDYQSYMIRGHTPW